MRRALKASVSASAIAVVASAVMLQNAHAEPFGAGWQSGWYVSLFGGGSFSEAVEDNYGFVYDTRLDAGFTFGGAVGTYLYPGLRGELELSWQHNDNRDTRPFAAPRLGLDGQTDVLFVLANIWKDFGTGAVRPYIGGGAGVGIADVESSGGGFERIDARGAGFATQIGGGVRVPVTEQLTFDLGYRLRALINASLIDNQSLQGYAATTSVFSHTIQAGFTYSLGSFADEASTHAMVAPTSDPLDSLWYVSVFGGLSSPQNTVDDYFNYIYSLKAKDGFTFGAAIGTYVAPQVRGEVEVSYSRHAFDNYTYFGGQSALPLGGHQEQLTFLVNFWKEFQVFELTPYIGGGVGAGLNIWDDVSFAGGPSLDGAGVGLATQFGLGVRYPVSENTSVDVGYRFRSISGSLITPAASGAHEKVSTSEHVFQAGLTYAFGNPYSVTPVADYDPAGRNFYVSLFGGGAFAEDASLVSSGYVYGAELNDGFTFGIAVGTDVFRSVRGELEVSYLNASADSIVFTSFAPKGPASGDVDQLYVLANLWWDIDAGLPIVPYLGGGVGLVVVDNEIGPGIPGSDDMAIASAGQLGAGVQFAVTDALSLDVGYRFKTAFEAYAEGSALTGFPHASFNFYTHVVQAGARWDF